MLAMKELIGKYKYDDLTMEIRRNLDLLLERANIVRVAWDKSMTVTSGYRSMEDHLRIYREKGITDPAKIPMQSRHLTGRAVDIADPDLKITAWLKENPKILEDAQLWCEEGNKDWVHFQTVAPASGKRWFLP